MITACIACWNVTNCSVQAVINNRKQKIIPAYELEIKLTWEGSADGSTAKGKVRGTSFTNVAQLYQSNEIHSNHGR